MRSRAASVPNVALRTARLAKAWSQADVAEGVGANAFTVGRWERGAATPSPYYQQQLCRFFGMTADALGFVSPLVLARPSAVGTQRRESDAAGDTALLARSVLNTFSDEPDTRLIGRRGLLATLRADLTRAAVDGAGVVTLFGLPGVGKTALAHVLASDAALREQFPDGVLWTGLGQAPVSQQLLMAWGSDVGLDGSEIPGDSSLKVFSERVGAVLATKRCLLIIDDVWAMDDVLPFLLGGIHCAHLITTRSPHLAYELGGNSAYRVPELDDEESLALLARTCGDLRDLKSEAAQALVRQIAGLPLALVLIGRHLLVQSRTGQPRRMVQALDRLLSAGERLQLRLPHRLVTPSGAGAAMLSLELSIATTYDHLMAPARDAWMALSLLAPKPYDFSEETALALVADAFQTKERLELLDTLLDAGIVEASAPGRYTLHQALADFAGERLRLDEDRHARCRERLVVWAERACHEHSSESTLLDADLPNLIRAFETAQNMKRGDFLVDCALSLSTYLESRGLWSIALEWLDGAYVSVESRGDIQLLVRLELARGSVYAASGKYDHAARHLQAGYQMCASLDDAPLCCAFLTQMGQVAIQRGETRRALRLLRRALRLARDVGNRAAMADIYQLLGEAIDCTTDQELGDRHYRKALALAKEVGHITLACKALQNLGGKAARRGEHVRGEAYLREGLELARTLGHRQRVAALLNNLGLTLQWQGRHPEAQAALQESLDIARAIAQPQRIVTALSNLGLLELELGFYSEADEHLTESCAVARETALPGTLCSSLCAAGEGDLRRGRLAQGERTFTEALALAHQIEDPDLTAYALYGLGRTLAAQGRFERAREVGRESIRLFAVCGIQTVRQATEWLHGLPREGNEIASVMSGAQASHAEG